MTLAHLSALLSLQSRSGHAFMFDALTAFRRLSLAIAFSTSAVLAMPHQAGAESFGSAAQLGHLKPSKAGSVDIRPASKALKRGLDAVDDDDTKTALEARAALKPGSIERKVLAWAIALNDENVDAATLSNIAGDLGGWPGQISMRRTLEKALIEQTPAEALPVVFSQAPPETFDAAFALAKALKSQGQGKAARKIIAPFFTDKILSKKQEAAVLKTFGSVLTRKDYRARVEKLLSKRRVRAAERIAGKAGATRLVAARAAVERKQKSAGKRLSAVPVFQHTDANYLFSKARYLRRKGQISNAARTLLRSKSVHSAAADRYYAEQRLVASDLLEAGKPSLAYKLAAHNTAGRASRRIDAEFYAGWIALRKLKKPQTASRHFAALLKMASTPLSQSRGHYWMGRALDAMGRKADAKASFERAARHDTVYYGQLAARKLGRRKISMAKASPSKQDRISFPRLELVQAIAKLESAGHPNKARVIYRHLGKHMTSPGQLALLAARAEKRRDYQTALLVGKAAFRRGIAVDDVAWPLGAIPKAVVNNKAGLPLAYAIARQESTFKIDARSHANALGLMQLLPGTAKSMARKAGVKYSKRRLTRDPAYNVRLGTEFLARQLDRFGGSPILTFAAYNAGPRRASEWLERFGDPRGASTDFAIDWIEQIPFSETRNYVMRVMENWQVYRKRLDGARLRINEDLTRGRRGA